MTYNIRSLRDDRRAVARVIRSAAPDAVCIQEAPRFWRWRSACRSLARATGLVWVAGGRTAGANIVLAAPAWTVLDRRDVLFSKDRGLHQRGVTMVSLQGPGGRLGVAGTHLDGEEAPRLRHVAELRAAMREFFDPAAPVVLGGDVNDEPGSPSWQALTLIGADAFARAGAGVGETSNTTARTRRIDALFASPGLTPVHATTLDDPDVFAASDHFPVVCDFATDPVPPV